MTRPYKKNRKKRRNTIKYADLSEEQKNDIVAHILDSKFSIPYAAEEINVGVSTINKIFAEKFRRKEQSLEEIEKDYKENVQLKTN